MLLQNRNGTLLDCLQHCFGRQRGKQDACILLHNAKQSIIISALPIRRHGMQILAVLLIPDTKTAAVHRLLFGRQRVKGALCTFLHHVVKTIDLPIGQTLHKGILLRQCGQQLFCMGSFCNKVRHFQRKFIRKPHNREEFSCIHRQGRNHCGGKHGVDIGFTVGQSAAFRKRTQMQINCGKPTLTRIKQGGNFCIRKGSATAVCINGKLCMVQTQLCRAKLTEPAAQTYLCRKGQKTVAACYNDMHIFGQTVRQRAEKGSGVYICQQMKIVNEKIAWLLSCKRMAKVICQQTAAGGIRRAGIIQQNGKPCTQKGILYAFPENCEIVGIDADTDDARVFLFPALRKIPVDSGCFAIAHWCNHSCQRTARNWAQCLL